MEMHPNLASGYWFISTLMSRPTMHPRITLPPHATAAVHAPCIHYTACAKSCTQCLDEHCRQPFLTVSDSLWWSLVVSTKSTYYPTSYLLQLYLEVAARDGFVWVLYL